MKVHFHCHIKSLKLFPCRKITQNNTLKYSQCQEIEHVLEVDNNDTMDTSSLHRTTSIIYKEDHIDNLSNHSIKH